MLTIGDVARETGISASAIRYYEDVGILPVPSRSGGRRRYSAAIFRQLALVRMAQEAGLRIEEIRMLIIGFPESTPASTRWQDVARRKLPEIDTQIRRLQAMRATLELGLRCGCLTLDHCADMGWPQAPTASGDAVPG